MRSTLLLCVSLVAGCQGQVSTDPPIVMIRNMHDQPRYNPQAASPFFEDGRTMRPQVEGTVSREMELDGALATGRQPDGSGWVPTIPAEVSRRFGGGQAMVMRGQERYGVYCAPCHSATGDGQGMVARRAAEVGSPFWPPTFHDPAKRALPDGQVFATISNGVRTMPAYRHSLSVEDRWAVVSYVRALQLARPKPGNAQAEATP